MAKKLTKQQIIDWATARGWHLDRYGHLQKVGKLKDKEGKPIEYRIKLSSTAMRYEVKVHYDGGQYGKPSNEWMRLRSGYYKDLTITDEGKLSGLKF